METDEIANAPTIRGPITWFARQMLSHLTTDMRSDRKEYTHLDDRAPKWMHEMVRAAHSGMRPPDDYKCEFVRQALAAIVGYDGVVPVAAVEGLHADADVDALRAWMDSQFNRVAYCEFIPGHGIPGSDLFIAQMQYGQLKEKVEVFQIVYAWLYGMKG